MGELSLWTAAKYWIAVSYLLAVVLAFDQLRRSPAQWEQAGRVRGFWVALSVIMGLHGLGQYAAAAYVVSVVPRFRGGEPSRPRRVLEGWAASIAAAWHAVGENRPPAERPAVAREFAWVAATLVFAAAFIHSIETVEHADEHWTFGAFFAVITCLQALWAGAIFASDLRPRILLVGVAINAAAVGVWVISRTVGVPFGPDPWQPEAVGVIDTLCTLDELLAIALLVTIVARLRDREIRFSPSLRLWTAVAGPLFIYSILAPFGGGGH